MNCDTLRTAAAALVVLVSVVGWVLVVWALVALRRALFARLRAAVSPADAETRRIALDRLTPHTPARGVVEITTQSGVNYRALVDLLQDRLAQQAERRRKE